MTKSKVIEKGSEVEKTTSQVIVALQKLEGEAQRSGAEFVRIRFRQGCLLRSVVEGEGKYGQGAVESIADELGVDQKQLYKYHALARRYSYDEAKIDKDIEKLLKDGRRVTMSYFEQKVLKVATNPDAVGGEENHREMLLGNAERAIESVNLANEQYPQSDEVQGTDQMITESIEDAAPMLVPKTDHLPIQKEKAFRSDFYRKWVTEQACIVSGLKPVDPHHVVPKGRGGNNAGDELCIPLHRSVHDQVTKFPADFKSICGDTEDALVRATIRLFIQDMSERVEL